jgi:acyl-CoA dehydrogenase
MNKVLQEDAALSSNFYFSDQVLQHFLSREISVVGLSYMHDKLVATGKAAAGRMNALSLCADQNGPVLKKRNFYGEPVNKIEFHPAYDELKKIAVESGMFSVKWEQELRERFKNERHSLGFSTSYLFAMSECGLFCPLCMTDGVARLIDRHCTEEDKERLLAHIATTNVEDLYTGAMFLTEKAGGSDVGANIVGATHYKDSYYYLNGEKWFCSNADAEIIFALARTKPEIKGTRGLSIFLIEKMKPDGRMNDLGYIRLKEKLGVRSMASAECQLNNTIGKLVGEEGQGFRIMTEMINLSRLYNSVAAVASMRRALAESYQFLKFRTTFGENALNHALIRTKLTEISAISHANFYMTWHAIKLLDAADNGNKEASHLLRLLTPMCKKSTASASVYAIRECMELMGGMGYIEDGVMPKILRDALVLPIWEGAGNIMVLDMLRATFKSEGLKIMFDEIAKNSKLLTAEQNKTIEEESLKVQQKAGELFSMEQDGMEATAKPVFERLTEIYQISIMAFYKDEISATWLNPAITFLIGRLKNEALKTVQPLDKSEVEKMIAWDI